MGHRRKTLEYTKVLNLRHDSSDPYKELANAIVEVAADDYRFYMAKKCKHGPSMSDLERRVLDSKIHEIEVFFQSDWGYLLSHGLAPVILAKLQNEFQQNNKEAVKREQTEQSAERSRCGPEGRMGQEACGNSAKQV